MGSKKGEFLKQGGEQLLQVAAPVAENAKKAVDTTVENVKKLAKQIQETGISLKKNVADPIDGYTKPIGMASSIAVAVGVQPYLKNQSSRQTNQPQNQPQSNDPQQTGSLTGTKKNPPPQQQIKQSEQKAKSENSQSQTDQSQLNNRQNSSSQKQQILAKPENLQPQLAIDHNCSPTVQPPLPVDKQNPQNRSFTPSQSNPRDTLDRIRVESPNNFINTVMAIKMMSLADQLGKDTEVGRVYHSEQFTLHKGPDGVYSAFDTQNNPLMQVIKNTDGVPQILFQNPQMTHEQQMNLLTASVPLPQKSVTQSPKQQQSPPTPEKAEYAFSAIASLTKDMPEINGVKQLAGNLYNFELINNNEYRISSVADNRGLIFQGLRHENGQMQVMQYGLNEQDENRLQQTLNYIDRQLVTPMTNPEKQEQLSLN